MNDRLVYATEGIVVKLDTIMKILERLVKLQEAQSIAKEMNDDGVKTSVSLVQDILEEGKKDV
tara:strand:+ start:5288 stop:5476 length:189 start_codon:yes stop_codon:yes gene_type:complete